MPLVPIQFSSGAIKSVDSFELSNPAAAVEARNFMHTDAGSLIDRPGLVEFASIGAFPVIGMAYFGSSVFAVTSDMKMWSVSSTGSVSNVTGTALTGTARPVFANDGDELAIVNGGTPRSWTGSGNTSALAGSPPSLTHIVYLDGYWIGFVIGDQELRWAGPTNTARGTWSAANFFQAESLPDDLSAIAVCQRELFAFGTDSTEIFQNFGDSAVPFRRVFTINRGIAAPYSVIEADNTLWFLSDERKIVQFQGRTPVTVSTPFYDTVLAEMGTVSDAWAWKPQLPGQFLLAWTFPTEELTIVYDYKTKDWCEWDGFVAGQSDRFRGHSHLYVKDWNKNLVGDFRTGTIWELTRDAKADGDEVRRLLRRTGRIDHGVATRKRSNFYLLDVKRGVGTNGDTEPVLEMRVNDDNNGWTDPVQIGLGYPGDPQKPIRVTGLRGVYRNRQIELKCTDSVEVIIRNLSEDVEVLSS